MNMMITPLSPLPFWLKGARRWGAKLFVGEIARSLSTAPPFAQWYPPLPAAPAGLASPQTTRQAILPVLHLRCSQLCVRVDQQHQQAANFLKTMDLPSYRESSLVVQPAVRAREPAAPTGNDLLQAMGLPLCRTSSPAVQPAGQQH